ncbi:N/A [soil metagenome]
MTRHLCTSPTAADDDVRRRWDERNVPARILTPDDPGAPPFVLHCGPPERAADNDDAWSVSAHVTADVIARFHAMCGAAVTTVAPATHDVNDCDDPTGATLGERLGCLPAGERYRPSDAWYTRSVRWALAQLWDAGLLYEAPHRSAWCPRCALLVDDVRDDAAQIEATSAIVRFPVVGDNVLARAGASLLVDVARPWTVPATTAVRIDRLTAYVLAQAVADDYPVVIARAAVPAVLGGGVTVHRDVPAAELLDVRYRPPSAVTDLDASTANAPVIGITGHDDVMDPSTGLAPVAPACAAGDWRIAADRGLPVVDVVDPDGRLTVAAGRYAGADLGDADQVIVDDLCARGLVVRVDHRTVTGDSCGRCDHAVVDRTRPAWLLATTRMAERLQTERAAVTGAPAAGQRAWATGDADWPVARPATTGVDLPLRRCDQCAQVSADRPGSGCRRCADGTTAAMGYAVEPLVAAAAMPFARFGFPAEPGSDTDVAHGARADLLVDSGTLPGRWTDAVITMAVLLWNAAGHDTALCVPPHPVANDDGDPSTRVGVPALLDRYGVDAVRMAALTEPVRWGRAANRSALVTAAGATLDGLRSACEQFVVAANGWTPDAGPQPYDGTARHVLDRWILAELSDTVARTRQHLAQRDLAGAARRVRRFIKHLTRWYLPQRRASLRDGPSSADDGATVTTHECLVTVAALLAPFAPCVSDALYEALVRADDPMAPDSVHLLRYPTPDPTAHDEDLRDAMTAARRIVALGHRARRDADIAAGQPLPHAVVTATSAIAPYWDALAPLLTSALAVTRIDRRRPGTATPDGPAATGPWHAVHDGELTVLMALRAGVTG